MTTFLNQRSFLISAGIILSMFFQNIQAMEPTQEDSIQNWLSENSLVVTNQIAPSIIHFDSQGRFKYLIPNGDTESEGVWRIAGDNLCVTITTLPLGKTPQEYCISLKEKSLGSQWELNDPQRGVIKYKLVKGHPKLDVTNK